MHRSFYLLHGLSAYVFTQKAGFGWLLVVYKTRKGIACTADQAFDEKNS